MQGVGLLARGPAGLETAAERIPLGETLHPGPDAEVLAARLPLFEQVPRLLADVTATPAS